MYAYLTYGEGLRFTLSEFENLSFKRIKRYMEWMDRQKALEAQKVEEAKANNPK